jgi:5,10-methylene-tetrahydrofolate dehydrogenase/methenyl tetrahydrofolate cyclohydrolase
MKRKACADIGIQSFETSLPEDVSEETLVATVRRYNWNPAVHGILVQLPLPKHINEKRVLSAVSLDKDVDGFHPQNVGELCMKVL